MREKAESGHSGAQREKGEEVMEENRLNKMKLDNYGSNPNNFCIDSELMVKITLEEYRSLVEIKAQKDVLIKQAETDKWAREQENKALKEENAKLKSENYDLLQKLQELQDPEIAADKNSVTLYHEAEEGHEIE